MSTERATPRTGRVLALYTLQRLVVFVGCYGLLLVLGARGMLAALGALLLSMVLSQFLLRRQRDAFVAVMVARSERRAAEKARLRGMLEGSGEG